MNIERALALTDPDEILKAAKEAEARNCEEPVVRQLWNNYFKATERKGK